MEAPAIRPLELAVGQPLLAMTCQHTGTQQLVGRLP
jgi:hypothetical protein